MDKIFLAFGGLALVIGLLLLLPLLGTLAGLIVGWIVGLFFPQTMLGIFAALGIKGFSMWQIGAFLGFVGGFFKTTSANTKS